jgi:hypothetical protein
MAHCAIVRMTRKLCWKKQAWVDKEREQPQAQATVLTRGMVRADKHAAARDKRVARKPAERLPQMRPRRELEEQSAPMLHRTAEERRHQLHVLENRSRMSLQFGS